MARIRVIHHIDDLADDLAGIPVSFATQAKQVVEWNVQRGNKIAQRLARERSGRHGKNYYKRLSGEMTGHLVGEYGPHDGGLPVGAGYRHGPPNTDLLDSADIVGPDFAGDVGDLADRLFREAGF